MMFLLLALCACNTQKHIETSKEENIETESLVNEKTDKNTVKYVTIVKYQQVKDSVTGEYPVESVTKIKETNNDKIVKETQEDTKEAVKETIVEDKKTEQKVSNYIWCFVAGAISMLVIIGLIKVVIWYVKSKTL